MACITMWRSGDRQCVLTVDEAPRPAYTLRIVHGMDVVRSESAKSADAAVMLSQVWRSEEHATT
jgi:hypothetical protein